MRNYEYVDHLLFRLNEMEGEDYPETEPEPDDWDFVDMIMEAHNRGGL